MNSAKDFEFRPHDWFDTRPMRTVLSVQAASLHDYTRERWIHVLSDGEIKTFKNEGVRGAWLKKMNAHLA